jgi:hypothetical protein
MLILQLLRPIDSADFLFRLCPKGHWAHFLIIQTHLSNRFASPWIVSAYGGTRFRL